MFDKALHRKLLREGAQGRGVVTKIHTWGYKGYTGLPQSYEYSLHGRITFDDGTHTEFVSHTLDSGKVGMFREGDIVPVRYDSRDHSNVVLDIPALDAQHNAEKQARQDQEDRDKMARIAYAEAQATGSPPPQLSPDQARAITAHRFAELNAMRRGGELTDEQFKAMATNLLRDSDSRIAASQSKSRSGRDEPGLADELTKLADLHDRGVLTDDEFAAQKAKLLGE